MSGERAAQDIPLMVSSTDVNDGQSIAGYSPRDVAYLICGQKESIWKYRALLLGPIGLIKPSNYEEQVRF